MSFVVAEWFPVIVEIGEAFIRFFGGLIGG